MAHTLTIESDIIDVKVNGVSVTTPYTLQNNDEIVLIHGASYLIVNGMSYTKSGQTIQLTNTDIDVQLGGRIPGGFSLTINYTEQPALTFKHFFDAGTIGSGTVKFRHYSQQEPSTSETWVLNETLKGEPYGLYNEYATTIDFTSNGENFIKIGVDNDHSTNPWIRYYTNRTENLVYSYGKWSNTAYRTLTFATAPTGDLLTWLQANGTKQGGGGGTVTPKLTKGTWRWLTPYDGMRYEVLKDYENNTTVTEFTSGGKTFTGFEYDPQTGSVAYSSDTEHVDVIVSIDDYFNETYKDITVTQDFDLEEGDFLYGAIFGELLTKLS